MSACACARARVCSSALLHYAPPYGDVLVREDAAPAVADPQIAHRQRRIHVAALETRSCARALGTSALGEGESAEERALRRRARIDARTRERSHCTKACIAGLGPSPSAAGGSEEEEEEEEEGAGSRARMGNGASAAASSSAAMQSTRSRDMFVSGVRGRLEVHPHSEPPCTRPLIPGPALIHEPALLEMVHGDGRVRGTGRLALGDLCGRHPAVAVEDTLADFVAVHVRHELGLLAVRGGLPLEELAVLLGRQKRNKRLARLGTLLIQRPES